MNTYPNQLGKMRGTETGKGCLRSGVIEVNDDTEEMGIAGQLAAVTHEEDGMARVYIFLPGDIPVWVGPKTVLSEEVLVEL